MTFTSSHRADLRAAVILAAVLLAAAGCSRSVKLTAESEVPIPNVTAIPVSMGIYYDEGLRNYVYQENTSDRPDWRIDAGESQVALFDQILPSMFEHVTPVKSVPPGSDAGKLDAVLSPKVDEMQFSLPSETKTDLFEAWVKYTMHLYAPDGKEIAHWPVTGYGKASDALLKSRDDGLKAAINQALRDAGAKLAIGFSHVDDVRAWLGAITHDCTRYAEYCKQ